MGQVSRAAIELSVSQSAVTAAIRELGATPGSTLLVRSPRRLWLPSRHPFLARAALSLRDVAQEPYAMLSADEAADTAKRYWPNTNRKPQIVLRTSSVEGVRSMVANGLGLPILSDMIYRPWLLEGRRLEPADLTDDIPPMDVGLVWRRNAVFSPQMTAFRDYFRGLFSAPQLARA